MIISHGRRYIFVHIPKTGGTSLALALEDRAMKDDILIGDTPKAIRRRGRLKALHPAGRLWKHSTLADIDGIISPHEAEDFFVFTLVRNPWDRIVSYYHWLRAQEFGHPAVLLAKQMGFREFVLDPMTARALSANPAASYTRAADGAQCCDLFIRLEHFAQDVAPLETHLGFALDLPISNASERDREWSHYYDAETQARIAEICADDIQRFGYKFEN